MAHSALKTIPEISKASSALVARLIQETEDGTILTYDELSDVAGFDVRKKPWPLTTARRVVLRDYQTFWDVVRGVGLKRCNASQVIDASELHVKKSRRASQRGLRILRDGTANRALTEPEASRRNFLAAVHGAIDGMTSVKTLKTIRQRVDEDGAQAPLQITIPTQFQEGVK